LVSVVNKLLGPDKVGGGLMPLVQSQAAEDPLSPEELRDVWPVLSQAERVEGFLLLSRNEPEDLFFSLSAADQAAIASIVLYVGLGIIIAITVWNHWRAAHP
jgi:hypothetical protein